MTKPATRKPPSSKPPDITKLTARIPRETKAAAALAASMRGLELQEFVAEALVAHCQANGYPVSAIRALGK
jgi:predicted HicB family RNase H-like nuclease